MKSSKIALAFKKCRQENRPALLTYTVSGDPNKIKSLVKKIHKFTNSKSKLKIGKKKYRPNEIWRMQAENKFITKNIGWKPSITFDEGLKKSIEWYKNFTQLYFDKKSFLIFSIFFV